MSSSCRMHRGPRHTGSASRGQPRSAWRTTKATGPRSAGRWTTCCCSMEDSRTTPFVRCRCSLAISVGRMHGLTSCSPVRGAAATTLDSSLRTDRGKVWARSTTRMLARSPRSRSVLKEATVGRRAIGPIPRLGTLHRRPSRATRSTASSRTIARMATTPSSSMFPTTVSGGTTCRMETASSTSWALPGRVVAPTWASSWQDVVTAAACGSPTTVIGGTAPSSRRASRIGRTT
mmetsp:Transcript_55215/g.139463  ORF Transcript_55215/g.139463 Transcript_55215/m.139463 type:complete len:233 (+) Transcript_55215:7538-8236(+)